MATNKEFIERLYKLNDDSNFVSLKDEPATLKMIKEYSSKKNIDFNEDFIEFLSTYGAIILEVIEEVWERPKIGQVTEMWNFGYVFFIYGLSLNENFPKWLSYE